MTTTMIRFLLTTMTFSLATAAPQTYGFPCLGSRVYPSYSSGAPDSWLGSFSPVDESEFQCATLGYGVTAANANAMMESEFSVETMMQHFQSEPANALSMEMWISLPDEPIAAGAQRSILTVGESTNHTQDPLVEKRRDECVGLDFQISQVGEDRLRILWRDENVQVQCRVVFFDLPDEVKRGRDLLHIVWVLGQLPEYDYQTRLSVFFNGRPYVKDGKWVYENADIKAIQFSGQLKKWNPQYHMQLFHHNVEELSRTGAFAGSVHELSIHDSYMTGQEIKEAYVVGLESIRQGAKPKTAPPLPVQSTEEEQQSDNSQSTAAPTSPSEEQTELGIPKLVAKPDEFFIVPQGSPTPITLSGESTLNPAWVNGWWEIKVEIMEAPRFGRLLLANDAKHPPIQTGDLLNMVEMERAFGVLARYEQDDGDYFNRPQVSDTGDDLGTQMESFLYRIVAVDTVNQGVLSYSSVVQQPVHVVRANEPAKLVTENLRTPFEWTEHLGFDGRENIPRTYFREPIQVQDPAKGKVERIRVDIFTNSTATVSLNEQNLHLAELEVCSKREFSQWRCIGTGENDRAITFVAYPSDVELILKDMIYDGVYNEPGLVTIQIWDGRGGNCLSRQEHAALVYENGRPMEENEVCYSDTLVIAMEARDGESAVIPEVQNLGQPLAVATTIFIIGLIGCSLVTCCKLCGKIVAHCKWLMAGNSKEIEPRDDAETEATTSQVSEDVP
ncbi:expressed unknown protein [Seminavis robusta]|uniref:Uncharacterized protein n=1 Tax=Seminavis robusta TaxID=568900 RepID=A0A9N8DNF9_9STRA|nr:expressed unknown protein [Seminavis robusta]|eukprot:Sro180_g078620.1 n/a (728) ;mRNA; r:5800-7983